MEMNGMGPLLYLRLFGAPNFFFFFFLRASERNFKRREER